MSGGEIKNVLTLDVSKFESALDRATGNLKSLDKHLKSASQVATEFEKSVTSLGGDIGSTAEKFKILDQTVNNLVSKLNQVANNGMDNVSNKTRRAKKDIEDFSSTAQKGGETLLSMADWTRRYGQALESIKPSLQSATRGQNELTKATQDTAKAANQSAAEQIKAKIASLETEKQTNAKIIEEKRKLAQDLQKIEAQIRNESLQHKVSADNIAARIGPYGGKNKIATEMAQANRLDSNADVVNAQIKDIQRLISEYTKLNEEKATQIVGLRREATIAEETAKAQRDAALQAAIAVRDEKLAQEAAAKEAARVKREEERMWREYEREQRKQAAVEARTAAKQAAEEARAARRAEREAEKAATAKAKAEARAALEEKRTAERQAKEEARAAAKAEADFNRWIKEEQKQWQREQAAAAKQAAKERVESERAVAQAAREANRQQIQAARELEMERRAAAKRAADYEREQAQQLVQMWKGMGQLWAAAKIEAGMSKVITKGSEYQKAEMRVQLMNLPTAEFEDFKKKAFDISREEKYISVIDAMQARLDALTAIGYNNKDAIDATLQSALRNAQLLMSAGYEHGSRSDLIKNLYGFAESRQVMGDSEKVKESFDIARRMSIVSGGKINIADMETVARNMGDLRQTMSAEGWMNVAALMEQFKVAGSQGHGGAGAGVSSVGTMLKMMSLYAAGKPVTNTAALQLLGADVMNDVYAGGSAEQFKDSAQYNNNFRQMVKTAGFKNVKEMSDNPVAFFSGLRDQVLSYTKDEKNRSKFYDSEDMDSKGAESAALKRFFAKMGMSNKTVDGLLLMMDKGFIERSGHVVESAKKLEKEDEAIQKMRTAWKNAVDEMNAGATNLAVAFVPLLEPMAVVARTLGQIFNVAAKFVQDNPIAAFVNGGIVAFGGLTLGIRGALSTFGMFGGIMSSIRTIMTGTSAATIAATGSWNGLQKVAATLALTFPKISTAIFSVVEGASGIGAKLLAPFAALNGTVGKLFGTIASFGAGTIAVLTRLLSWAGWVTLAAQFGWVIGEWISSIKVDGITIGDHMQNIFLSIETGWKNMLLNIQEKWIDFKKLIGGDDYLGESADRKEIEAEREKLRQYAKDMKITPPEPKKGEGGADKKTDTGGNTNKSTGGKSNPGATKNLDGLFDKPTRQFENAFLASYADIVGKKNIEQLKLGTVVSRDPSYEAQAKEAFTAKWLSGDFDDGKDPTKRRFVKGGAKYDSSKGWSPENIDWNAKDKQSGKTVRQWLDEYAAMKKVEDERKAVTFANERAAAADVDAANAIDRLTDGHTKDTDAMKALNRELARMEARNPGAAMTEQYQISKRDALTGQATADYANSGADLIQKNKELQAQLFGTERDRLVASVNATYEAEANKYRAIIDNLDKQIQKHKEAGDTESETYKNAVKARILGEAEFTKYLENIQIQRQRALMSPLEKMLEEWRDGYKQLNDMSVNWANGFADSLASALMTGKADFSQFVQSVASDLTRYSLRQSFGTLMGMIMPGPEAKKDGEKGGTNAGETASGIVGMFGKVGESLKGFWDKLTGSTQAVGDQNAAVVEGVTKTVLSTTTTMTKTGADAAATTTITTMAGAATAATEALIALASAASAGAGAGAGGDALGGLGSLFGDGGGNPVDSLELGDWLTAFEFAANGAYFSGNMSYFANGGAFTNSVYSDPTIFKFADGGKFGVMGEAGPEAVMPLSRDGSGRLGVTVQGGVSSDSPTVNIAITVNNDGSTKANTTGDDAGTWRRMADRVKGVVQQELVVQQRPGGLLYK